MKFFTFKFVVSLLFVPFVLMLMSCSATSSRNMDFLSSYKNLKQESQLSDARVYRGDAKMEKDYDSVYLEEVRLLRPEGADKDGVTDADLVRLRGVLNGHLRKGVRGSAYKLVNEKGAKTLGLRVAVTDVQPGNPKVFASGYLPYVGAASTVLGATTGNKFGAGSAVVEAEVVDSVTREQFFAIIDENVGSKLQVSDGLKRWGHVEKIFEEWSKRIASELTRIRR